MIRGHHQHILKWFLYLYRPEHYRKYLSTIVQNALLPSQHGFIRVRYYNRYTGSLISVFSLHIYHSPQWLAVYICRARYYKEWLQKCMVPCARSICFLWFWSLTLMKRRPRESLLCSAHRITDLLLCRRQNLSKSLKLLPQVAYHLPLHRRRWEEYLECGKTGTLMSKFIAFSTQIYHARLWMAWSEGRWWPRVCTGSARSPRVSSTGAAARFESCDIGRIWWWTCSTKSLWQYFCNSCV